MKLKEWGFLRHKRRNVFHRETREANQDSNDAEDAANDDDSDTTMTPGDANTGILEGAEEFVLDPFDVRYGTSKLT